MVDVDNNGNVKGSGYVYEDVNADPLGVMGNPAYSQQWVPPGGNVGLRTDSSSPYSEDTSHLASLFSDLNQISAIRERVGGGTGGGTQQFEGNMDMNKLIALNPYMDKNVTSFNRGGLYESAVNEAIAKEQLSSIVANSLNKRMPQANYGMKRKYQEGGNYPHNMYHPETGYKIVAEDESAHNKLNKAGFGHTPKAAYGMKMKKRYTNGGRF